MKALSLWQPWASLIAVGAKRVETRHWQPPASVLGQRVAIHAARNRRELGLVDFPPFSTRLELAKAEDLLAAPEGVERSASLRRHIPLGGLVAVATLARCAPITAAGAARLDPDERAFGNYDLSDGQRYAWVLTDVEPLAVPLKLRGGQGFFDVHHPDDVGPRGAVRPGARVLDEVDLGRLLPALTEMESVK